MNADWSTKKNACANTAPKHTFAAVKEAGATTYVASVVSSPPSPSRYVPGMRYAQEGTGIDCARRYYMWLLTALQHILAGLKRTRDQKLSSGWMISGQLNFAPLGVGLKFRRDSRGSPQVLQVYFASNAVQS